jgi:CRP/FNR family transcriptional regulator
MNTVMKLNSPEVLCPNCRLSDLCLPFGLQENEVKLLAAIVKNKRHLQTDDLLYQQGYECQNLYVVKSGSFRSFITNLDGIEQTIAFYLPGELMGLDALNHEYFTCSTVALETGSVCELTLSSLNHLCSQIPNLQIQMLRSVGKEIASGQDLIAMLRHHSAKERMAVFFLSLSCRYGALGFSTIAFNLSMPRYDIANFLGLSIETVSRQLAYLGKLGVMTVNQRSVQINDLELLKAIVEPCSAK